MSLAAGSLGRNCAFPSASTMNTYRQLNIYRSIYGSKPIAQTERYNNQHWNKYANTLPHHAQNTQCSKQWNGADATDCNGTEQETIRSGHNGALRRLQLAISGS